MIRFVTVLACLALFGAAKMPVERSITALERQLHFRNVAFDLGLRDQIGQFGFFAALAGFRSIIADILFIRAHIAWERTEWGRLALLLSEVTTLQPRALLFWEMAAWHMAWNASAAAVNDPAQPRLALRLKAQREYFAVGRDFLLRGIKFNPERPQLYEALARLYRDKYNDHERAAEYFGRAAALPGALGYDRRFAAYELSRCEGREREAYDHLRALYLSGESERLPTLLSRLKYLEQKLDIPDNERIP